MRIGSLFSGIGGLELGLEWSGIGHTIWQVEQNDFCRAVLAKHWPHVDRSVSDVRAAGAHNLAVVDLICGGFPCQDIADTEGAGLEGARSGLWFEMLRVVRELHPRCVIIENVAGLSTKGLDRVLTGLAASGYDAVWFPLRASDFGAPHGRARIFVVAYPDAERRKSLPPPRLHVQGPQRNDAHGRGAYPPQRDAGSEAWRAYASAGGPCPGILRGVDGFPTILDRARIGAAGNAVMPEMGEVVGHVARGILEAA